MTNTYRGEAEIEIAGITYRLRPTFAGLAALRRATGVSPMKLLQRMSEMDFGPEEIQAVVTSFAVEPKPPKDLGERIVEHGLADLMVPVTKFLAGALSGGREGNAEAPSATTS